MLLGSSNSQDSFPAAGSSNASMDGYGSYQSGYTGATPGGPSSDYTPPPPRPPSQSSAPSPHQGKNFFYFLILPFWNILYQIYEILIMPNLEKCLI